MARLPIPGGDDNTWGNVLNSFLEVSLNSDGSISTTALQQAGGVTSINGISPSSGSVTLSTANLPDTYISGPTNNQVLSYDSVSGKWINQTPSFTAPVTSVEGMTGAVTGLLQATNNLSDLNNTSSARTNLGLGSAATMSAGAFVSQINPSGDTTGATDYAAIANALSISSWACLGPGVCYINQQIVVPDNGTLMIPKGATLRVANGANLAHAVIVTENALRSTPFHTSTPAYVVGGGNIDLNCTNQNFAGQSWLTSGPDSLDGPDAIFFCNSDAEIDINVLNPVRHGIVTADVSVAGNAPTKNIYNNKLSYGVYGYAYLNSPTSISGVSLSAGSNTVSVSSLQASSLVSGMVATGQGFLPGTVIVSIVGTTVTFSQNIGSNPSTVFYTTWGQRGRWNTNFGNGCTDGNEASTIVRCMYGDWASKFDSLGGWRISQPRVSECGYSAFMHLSCENTILTGIDALGFFQQYPVQVTTLNQTLNSGSNYSSLTVDALPCALSTGSVLVMRSTDTGIGSPLVCVLSAAAAAGATSISVYRITPGGNVSSSIPMYLPAIGHYEGMYNTPPAENSFSVSVNETSGVDYIYRLIRAPGSISSSFQSVCANTVIANEGSSSGATSIEAAFIGCYGAGQTWTVRAANRIIQQGPTSVITPQITAGVPTITFSDGSPT